MALVDGARVRSGDPHPSTFSKDRHGRFQESKPFEQLFEQIVQQCVEVGPVEGKRLSMDGSFVEANVAKESRIPREQLGETAQVHLMVAVPVRQRGVQGEAKAIRLKRLINARNCGTLIGAACQTHND